MAGEEVQVPAVGGVPKKVVIGVGAALVVFVAYKWWQSRSSGSTATPYDPNAIDPQTGLTYGAEAMQAAGYVNPAPVSDTSSSTTGAPSPPTTDTDWVNRVVADLGNLGMDPGVVSTALSLYLTSQQVTADQASIIRQAWAWEGKPPQHPTLPILLTTDTGTPGGGGGGGGGGTPPPPAPTPPPTPGNIHVLSNGGGHITVGWNSVGGADHYAVGMRSAPTLSGVGTAMWGPEAAVNGTSYTFPVTKGHWYDVIVRAYSGSAGGPWPTSGLWVQAK